MCNEGEEKMKKWAVSAVVYLLVVIGGFMLFSKIGVGEKNDHQENHEQETHTSDHEHGDHQGEDTESQIKAEVNYVNDSLAVKLVDDKGNLFDDLEMNHEKLLHLIIVDEHLDQFYHVHPEKTKSGTFELDTDLSDGTYKAFVDIKPNKLSYQVEPILLTIGENGDDHSHHALQPDQMLTKKIDEYEVSLNMNGQKVNEPITLTFELDESYLEPYLGAMGHVVILNEEATEFIHVHPVNDNEPIFETQFSQAGTYKIWAEFKQNGVVRAFPFVVEIQ
jgi:hypothetical protein